MLDRVADKLIDLLIRQLQDETPNCGGSYHFSMIQILNKGEDIRERILKYLERIDAYKNPYVTDELHQTKILAEDRNLNNLILEPIANLLTVLDEKLEYWSNHQTSLDCRETTTDQYPDKLKEFKEAFVRFLDSKQNTKSYAIKGIDTYFSFGKDHVNDDLLIESDGDLYILHFGWSS